MKYALLVVLLASAPSFAQKKKQLPPMEGTEFRFSPDNPKYATCDIEFRDPTDAAWPNFFYGKPKADGKLTWSAKTPGGAFTMVCGTMAQKSGEQDRKVLAPLLIQAPAPKVELALAKFGEVKTEKGPKGKALESFPAHGTLTVGGKETPVVGSASVRFGYPKDAEQPDQIVLSVVFTVKGTDIGLKFADPIQVTAGTIGFTQFPASKK